MTNDNPRTMGPLARLGWLVRAEHRYVLLGTSVLALIGMFLSSSARPELSVLRHAFVVELVMYWVLVAWLAISGVGLVSKLLMWRTYGERSFMNVPAVRRLLHVGSLLVAAIVAVLVVDRVVLGFASAWQLATTATDRPSDGLPSALYMLWNSRQIYLTGIATTIGIATFGTIIAFFLALLLAFARIQRPDRPDNDAIRLLKVVGSSIARVYSTIVRGTPMLVQGFIVFYGVFALLRMTGLTTTEINAIWSMFLAGLVTVSLNSTAYMMEVLRGGIESVDHGQTEAARSLGLSQWQTMVKVVFPQGIRHAIPGLSNELVINIKDSSALSVIGVFDLTFAATSAAGIYYRQFENYLVAACFYLVLTMVASWLLSRFARCFHVKSQPLLGTSDGNVAASEEE